MISCSRFESLVDDLLDGALDAARTEEAEAHATGCRNCGVALEQRRALARATAALPRSISPSRDLWPGIRDRRPPVTGTAAATRRWIWAGAVAAVLTVVLLAPMLRDRDISPTATPASESVEVYEAAERQYIDATRELIEAIEALGTRLSPSDQAALQENLQIIDQAIGEAQATLQSAPQDPRGGRLMTALYRRKLELLWKVSRFSS